MGRQRLNVAKVEDRLAVIKVLAVNGYCTKIVTDKKDGKKVTFIEYWEEENK